MATACAESWDSPFVLDDYCIEELNFWHKNLERANQRNCFVESKPSYFVYSDASATGCGAIIQYNHEEMICHKLWGCQEKG